MKVKLWSRRTRSVCTVAGTGHGFTTPEDHINYLMVRFDPDKVTPIRGEEQSPEHGNCPSPLGHDPSISTCASVS